MTARLDRSVVYYLRRQKLLPAPKGGPRYEMGTLHPHSRPVTVAAEYAPSDTPGEKVITTQ